MQAPDLCALALHLPLTREQVIAIEADLLKLIHQANVDVPTALIAQSAYLRLLTRFLTEARAEQKIELDERPEANLPLIQRFSERMESGEAGRPWGRLLEAAEKGGPAPRLKRVVLGTVLAAVRDRASRPGVISRYLLFAFGLGKIDFGEGAGKIAYRRLARNPLRLDDPSVHVLLRKRLSDAIAAGWLLAYEDVRFSHAMLLAGFGLARWHAGAAALRAGREGASMEEWNEAFDFVDRCLGPSSDFPKRLEEDGTTKTILDALTHRPLFPYAMCHG